MHGLDVFDFDGTLFKTPEDTPENRRVYEEATGLPWVIDKQRARFLSKKLGKPVGMRRGWWGRRETLEPPLVPNPAPAEMFVSETRDAFLVSKANPDRLTMVLTGRHFGLRHQVLRVLGDGGLVLVEKLKSDDLHVENVDPQVICLFLGQDGPKPKGIKPPDTLPWKIWILEQYVEIYPDIQSIHMWEDRPEHVEAFQQLLPALVPEVLVNYVTETQAV